MPGDVFIQPAAWIERARADLLTVLLSALTRRWAGAGGSPARRCWRRWVGVGVARLQAPLPPPPGLKVVLVQGNVAEGQKWDRALVVRDLRALPAT